MKKILGMLLTIALLLGGIAPIDVHAEAVTAPDAAWAEENGWTKYAGYYTKTVDNITYKLQNIWNQYEVLSGIDSSWQIQTTNSPDASGVVTILASLDGFPIKSVGAGTFGNNMEVTECVIPEGVELVGTNAFRYCYNLTKVSFPNSLKMIDGSAFYDCRALTELNIPPSVEYVAATAFCRNNVAGTGLETLIFEGNAPQILYADSLYQIDGIIINVCEGTSGWDSEAWEPFDLNVIKLVDWRTLNRLLGEAGLLIEADYLPETWGALQEAIAAAEGLPEDADADTVDQAITALRDAMTGLIVDRTELNRVLEEAGLLAEADYTAESWAVLQEAIVTAEGLAENADVESVHGAIAAIEEAIAALVADRTELDRVLEEAGLLVDTDYTAESWEALQETIAAGQALTETASADEVHGAAQAIEEAMEGLVLAEGVDVPSVNKEGLEKALQEAAGLVEAYYTSESWEALQEAVTAANEVMEAADVTPADVISVTKALQEAIDTLDSVTPVWEIFKDVTEGQWYVDAVQHVYYKEIMEGNGDKFTPNGKMTRGMFVTTLYRLAGEPEVTDYSACEELGDVAENAWYTDAVCWAYSTKVTTGYESDRTFRTNVALTREQLATFVYRYAQYQGMDISVSDDLSGLVNADKVKPYAEKEVKWAVGAGLISGLESTDANGTAVYDLAPQGTATRAQMASILQRFMGM